MHGRFSLSLDLRQRPQISLSAGAVISRMNHQEDTVRVSFARRATLRAAVRLCITPFLAALSMADWASLSCTSIASPLPSATAWRTFLTTLLTRVLTERLRKRRISFWRARLIADLWLANGQFLSRCVLAILKKLDIYRGIGGLSTLFSVRHNLLVRGEAHQLPDREQWPIDVI